MYAPGIVGLVFAAVVLLLMRDNPENFGHAPVQAPKPKAQTEAKGAQPPPPVLASRRIEGACVRRVAPACKAGRAGAPATVVACQRGAPHAV